MCSNCDISNGSTKLVATIITIHECWSFKMEKNLEKTLDDINNTEGIIGCILADHAGLCLGAKGNASTDSAGIIAAIADQVAKLEPKSPPPVISLQNDSRKCLIQRQGAVVGAIYKDISM